MESTKRFGKSLVVGVVTALTAISVGCLARPVGTQPPTTKVNFATSRTQQAVDKVDILFAIDNSGSMLDKQKILADAVPNLLRGLLEPRCLDPKSGAQIDGKTADPTGNKDNNFNCPMGTMPEFTPVTDMHIGVVSSSLGTFGGDVCPETMARFDDHGRLLDSTDPGAVTPLGDANPSNFLSWFPNNQTNQDTTRHPAPPTPAIGSLDVLKSDFQKLVSGVGQTGCGLESQLESVYHFLIAPDPWTKITVQGGIASLGAPGDVDTDLLQQRADFLRPDSLVAIILLSDEDDSSADPQSLGGQGWNFMNSTFVGSTQVRNTNPPSSTAPRPTSVCATNPLADGKDGKVPCTSCAFALQCAPSDAACNLIHQDPNCQKTGGFYTPEEESLNTRFVRMKERFGVDPQYPISRYTDGLSKATVPDRASEHPLVNGKPGDYIGTAKCTNPLFAKTLPRTTGDDLCNLPRGPRTPDLVFFAVVGGVPNTLLHFDANDSEKSAITDSDWSKILGKDPLHFDYSGIDPHMIQSITPRPGLPPPSATKGDNGDPNDPVGREWDTQGADLQYACTFPLPTASQTIDNVSGDCAAAKNPPLCGTTPGQQIRAKAYPTVRELEVVRALKDQGIIASLCPISLTVDANDPTYGYNPAVISIVNRLKNALTTQCLPRKLTRDETQEVPCLVLATLGDGDTCDKHDGLSAPAQEILDQFRQAQKAQSGSTADGGIDLTKRAVCELAQLPPDPGSGTCATASSNGWCYVENTSSAQPAGRCPQAIIFSSGTAALSGATFNLQCIVQSSEEAGAGGP